MAVNEDRGNSRGTLFSSRETLKFLAWHYPKFLIDTSSICGYSGSPQVNQADNIFESLDAYRDELECCKIILGAIEGGVQLSVTSGVFLEILNPFDYNYKKRIRDINQALGRSYRPESRGRLQAKLANERHRRDLLKEIASVKRSFCNILTDRAGVVDFSAEVDYQDIALRYPLDTFNRLISQRGYVGSLSKVDYDLLLTSLLTFKREGVSCLITNDIPLTYCWDFVSKREGIERRKYGCLFRVSPGYFREVSNYAFSHPVSGKGYGAPTPQFA